MPKSEYTRENERQERIPCTPSDTLESRTRRGTRYKPVNRLTVGITSIEGGMQGLSEHQEV